MDKMMNDKRGVASKFLVLGISGIIMVVVLFNIVSNTIGEVSTAGTAINTTLSGSGLAPLFAGNGSVVILVILAGVLLATVFYWLKVGK